MLVHECDLISKMGRPLQAAIEYYISILRGSSIVRTISRLAVVDGVAPQIRRSENKNFEQVISQKVAHNEHTEKYIFLYKVAQAAHTLK